ncbi:DNA-binding response regulator [Roseomonas marmotae]|nr:DNA-binding response regulator [Roseomonas marmotae]
MVHLIRTARFDNNGPYFQQLYLELMRRIDAALPRVEGERIGKLENVHAASARDQVRDVFNKKLIEDQQNLHSSLDYFEVMFAGAVASLRATALRSSRREAARSAQIERDDDTLEPSVAVERAVGSLDLKEELLSKDPIYRSRVAAAIDALPEKQRRVIEMILQGMPLDSSDEQVLSIRKVLGVTEKTVRNRRDDAIRRIREMIGLGAADE